MYLDPFLQKDMNLCYLTTTIGWCPIHPPVKLQSASSSSGTQVPITSASILGALHSQAPKEKKEKPVEVGL